MQREDFERRLKDDKIYNPVGDYKMVTDHAHLVDEMYFHGKQRERYLMEAEFIAHVMQESSGGKTYVDAGCGTGIHLKLLREKGFSVSGFDLRKQMVEVAKKRNPGIAIVEGNMKEFPLKGKVHGISAMYGAINYLENEEDFRMTLRGFLEHLVDKGVAIIDTRYQPNLDEKVNIWATDSWVLAKRWIKCEGKMDSVYRVFYAIPKEGVMEMEDHRQYFQDPYWISRIMNEEGFAKTEIFDSYNLNSQFDPSTGNYRCVVVGYKNE